MIDASTRPCLAAKVRLRFDRATQGYLLLYPERGLALNGTGAEIARLCTGDHTVQDIIETLCGKYPDQGRDRIEREVGSFLDALAERGLLRDPSEPPPPGRQERP
jgi:coenzyme PQQ biosynthesis protein PqqD